MPPEPDWFLVSAGETLIRLKQQLIDAMKFISSARDEVLDLKQGSCPCNGLFLECKQAKIWLLASNLKLSAPCPCFPGATVCQVGSGYEIIRSYLDVSEETRYSSTVQGFPCLPC